MSDEPKVCNCPCHTHPGIMHVMPCCTPYAPTVDPKKLIARASRLEARGNDGDDEVPGDGVRSMTTVKLHVSSEYVPATYSIDESPPTPYSRLGHVRGSSPVSGGTVVATAPQQL